MGTSVKPKLIRSLSIGGLEDLQLTGVSLGVNKSCSSTGPQQPGNGAKLESSKSLPASSCSSSSDTRAPDPVSPCYLLERACTGCLGSPAPAPGPALGSPGLKPRHRLASSHPPSASSSPAGGAGAGAGCQYVVRWPSECQVLPHRIRHIKSLPSAPEVFYDSTGKEASPRPLGEEHGVVVYNYKPNSQVNYFSRSVPGGSQTYGQPVRSNLSPDTLLFESRFESGNLEKAVRITDTYYELHLRPDFYTNRHCQWFYFQIQNMRTDVKYRFSIVNFTKPDSLYTCGMKPVLYSKIEADRHFVGWTRVGDNIRYYKNDTPSEDEEDGPTYTLTFTLTFPHGGDTVYLAHCYPYRYSDLTEDLLNIQTNPERSQFCSQRLLCRTLAGNNVHLLTISTPDCLEELKGKICIVLSARVHPGETPSSWMMRGVIQFLTGSSDTARALRDRFVFKIVPMLNPDGVIIGNTRCNLAGRDLNRQYKNVVKEAFPPVYQTKMMVKKMMEEGSIGMYCDFHAHSRKFNIFMYGCENRRHSDKYLKEQIFPLMLHKNASDKFSFESSKFTIQRSKESTGRVVFWNMGIMNSFTLEASYGGSNLGSRAYTHFTTGDYQALGKYYCETLHDFYAPDPPLEQLRGLILQRLIKEESSAVDPVNIALSDYSSLSSSGASDNEEEAGAEAETGDSVNIARKSLIKRRRKKQRQRNNFYSTNYSEFLTPDNYTVEAQENVVKKTVSDGVVVDSPRDRKTMERQSTVSSGFESTPSGGMGDQLLDLADELKNVNIDSGESTSTDDVNDDLDYLNLVYEEPTLSDLEPDGFIDEAGSQCLEYNSEEFTALSCEKVHSEILESVNRIRSSILNSRKNFLQNPPPSVEGNGMQTSGESTPAKFKAKTKSKKTTATSSNLPDGGSSTAASAKPNKKKKKAQKSAGKGPTNSAGKKKETTEREHTPFKARTFYKKAGNITKLEVFLNQDVKKKKKKKSESKELTS